MKKIMLGLAVITLLATSCKKDVEEAQTITPTKENLTGSYLLSKIAVKAGNSETDVTNSMNMEACDRDDVYKLNADLSYQIVDAGVQCDNDYTDTWSLTNASTIVIDGDMYTIRKFDGKSLELTEDLNGATYITYLSKQ